MDLQKINHRNELHFDISKKIFDDKMIFLEQFSERFAAESAGEVWDIEKIR